MLSQDLSFSKTLNPSFCITPVRSLKQLQFLRKKASTFKFHCSGTSCLSPPAPIFSLRQTPFSSCQNDAVLKRDVRSFAGRSKKKPGGSSSGRIEGDAERRREAKRNARIKSKKLAESLFYRLKNPNGRNHPDNFSEDELEMIGLGYDRMVRFMDRDDPNLRHPHDWYKYGEYGPYSWRGVVVGDPIRGKMSDMCVTLIGEVRNHEEWEKIEQFEMSTDFGKRMEQLDKNIGFRYFWVFIRHPKWRLNEKPWEQWTLVCEVVVEAEKTKRLDKWNLMARLGNKTRSLIGQCAAWMRPDIIYVKKPVFQCRFEPQDNFFNALIPLLDPTTENDYLFELNDEEDGGRVQLCTYFNGLCKIVKVNPKAFVDDVVNAYDKMSDEKKSRCLEFLFTNHPMNLLHPYTKEWKAKLEEMELGCDAPDEDEEVVGSGGNEGEEPEFTDWVEDDGKDDDDEEQEDVVLDMKEGGVDEFESEEESEDSGAEEEEDEEEEDEEKSADYWQEEYKKAISSADKMERIAKWSVERSNKVYEKQLKAMEDKRNGKNLAEEDGDEEEDGDGDGDETAMRGARVRVSEEEWKIAGYGPWKKRIKKSKIPPELFLRAAVRPFTYRNLVKEIVLTRHAILENEIGVD